MDQQDSGASFAQRLDYVLSVAGYLDAEQHWRGYSTAEAADLISQLPDRYGVKLSRSYLGMLRSGRYANPSIAVVIALVRFFNDHRPGEHPEISVDWLASGAPARDPLSDRDGLSPLADQQVRHIAMRAGKMTVELRSQLIAILDMMDGKT